MSDEKEFELTLEQESDYEFRIRFGGTSLPALTTDEPAPLGGGAGPNPARLLVAAVANCLAASLLFALRKFKNDPGRITARARATMGRNEHRRWRVERVAVELHLSDTGAALEHLDRILEQFEEFCIVTQSVREGVEIDVSVVDGEGNALH